MKSVSISGSPRENVGKKDAKKHRNEGKVPCVLYGGKEQIHFSTDETSFKQIVYTPEASTIKLNIQDKEYHAILQDIQYHPVSDRILHADFMEIFNDKPVIIHIPIKVTGNSQGVLKGGRFIQKLRKVKIKALVADLPDNIEIDITPLDINDSIKISDLKLNKVTFLDPPSSVVVGVRVTRVVVEDTTKPAEGAAAPAATAAAPAAGDKGKEGDKGKDKGKDKK
mgnify:CR=1 FL=1